MSVAGREHVDAEAAERIADLALEIARRQQATWDSLDSKAWQVFGSGSIILGLGIAGDIGGFGLAIGLGAYAFVAFGSLRCLWLRKFETLPYTADTWTHYWFRGRIDVNHAIVDTLSKTEASNAGSIQSKGVALGLALAGLVFETATLAIAAAV